MQLRQPIGRQHLASLLRLDSEPQAMLRWLQKYDICPVVFDSTVMLHCECSHGFVQALSTS